MSVKKTSSELSVRESRIGTSGKRSSSKPKVSVVKFSAAEIAADVPVDISDRSRFPIVGVSGGEWMTVFALEKGFVQLTAANRKHFATAGEVNAALELVARLRQIGPTKQKSKKAS